MLENLKDDFWSVAGSVIVVFSLPESRMQIYIRVKLK